MSDEAHPLAEWRERQRPPVTQDAFGRRVGVSRWTINAIETGRRMPSRILIGRIKEATAEALAFEHFQDCEARAAEAVRHA